MFSPILPLNDNKFQVEPRRGYSSSSYPDALPAIHSECTSTTNTKKAHLENLTLNLNQSNDSLNDLMANLYTNTKLRSFPMIWYNVYCGK